MCDTQAEALEQQYDNGEIDEETYTEQLGELATSVSGVTDVGEGEETDELRELVTMRVSRTSVCVCVLYVCL